MTEKEFEDIVKAAAQRQRDHYASCSDCSDALDKAMSDDNLPVVSLSCLEGLESAHAWSKVMQNWLQFKKRIRIN